MNKCGLIIIGNEILSGRTQDSNLRHLSNRLETIGLVVHEVRIVPDIEEMIVQAIIELKNKYLYIFTTGGIGSTHDDITVSGVAKALNRNLEINHKALVWQKKFYPDKEITPAISKHFLMPNEAELIVDHDHQALSFWVENIYVFAGVPPIMAKMLEIVLPSLIKFPLRITKTITCNLLESDIADDLAVIQQNNMLAEIGSYPSYSKTNSSVTFVIKAYDESIVNNTQQEILTMIKTHHGKILS